MPVADIVKYKTQYKKGKLKKETLEQTQRRDVNIFLIGNR